MAEFTMGASLKMTNNFSAPMSAATQSAEHFKQTLNTADQAVGNLDKGLSKIHGKGLQELSTSASQAATAANSVVAPVDGIVTSTNKALNAIQSFNRGWQTVKQLPSTLHNIGSALKTNVADGFVSAKLQASLFVASVKAVGKQKLTGTVLLEEGAALNTVQELLGHYDPKFTATQYGHVTTRMRTEATDKLSGLLTAAKRVGQHDTKKS